MVQTHSDGSAYSAPKKRGITNKDRFARSRNLKHGMSIKRRLKILKNDAANSYHLNTQALFSASER